MCEDGDATEDFLLLSTKESERWKECFAKKKEEIVVCVWFEMV